MRRRRDKPALRGAAVGSEAARGAAAPGDPAVLWPADRGRARLGTIKVTGLHADDADGRQIFFDPNNLPDGIEPSDDPLLSVGRGASCAVSITRRTAN